MEAFAKTTNLLIMENKLIPMTDFVLNSMRDQKHRRDKYDDLCAYAEFLKQHLVLGMFLPCDKNGNILKYHGLYEHFKNSNFSNTGNWETQKQCEDAKEYFKAKENVLFEGFMNIDTRSATRKHIALMQKYRTTQIDAIIQDQYGLMFYDEKNEISRLHIVEDLLNFSELQLTESALKKIEL